MIGGGCGSCLYAEPSVGDDQSLFVSCRRYPPVMFVIEDDVQRAWPQVDHGDWCGEYRPDPKGTPLA